MCVRVSVCVIHTQAGMRKPRGREVPQIRSETVYRAVTNDSIRGDIDVWGQRLEDKVREKCLRE